MRAFVIAPILALSLGGTVAIAAAQTNNLPQRDSPAENGGSVHEPPQSGSSTAPGSLSHELSQSGGVIHPPPSGDRNVVPPPNQASSRTPVIHPPGTPGGNPRIEPK
jgi:hypothetical protein